MPFSPQSPLSKGEIKSYKRTLRLELFLFVYESPCVTGLFAAIFRGHLSPCSPAGARHVKGKVCTVILGDIRVSFL